MRRGGSRGDERRAESVLARLGLLRLDLAVVERAAALDPMALRSLDAIHLATALSLGRDLGLFVSYDRQCLDSAEALRLPVGRGHRLTPTAHAALG